MRRLPNNTYTRKCVRCTERFQTPHRTARVGPCCGKIICQHTTDQPKSRLSSWDYVIGTRKIRGLR